MGREGVGDKGSGRGGAACKLPHGGHVGSKRLDRRGVESKGQCRGGGGSESEEQGARGQMEVDG